MRTDQATFVVGLALALWFAGGPAVAEPPTFGAELEGFDYPWPVKDYAFSSQGEAMTMRSMDVAPTTAPNGATAVLCTARISAPRPGRRRSGRSPTTAIA